VPALPTRARRPALTPFRQLGQLGSLHRRTFDLSASCRRDGFGGKYVIRTENIVGAIGTPPKRFVVIAFDSMDKAKAWSASTAQQEVDAIAAKSLNSRRFLVDGMVQ
jgi:uncharacterized protein (DUF1330 family)